MKDTNFARRPSVTAAWVAAGRGFSALLPSAAAAALAPDPYAVQLAGGAWPWLHGAMQSSRVLRQSVWWLFPQTQRFCLGIAYRTRTIDDIWRGFLSSGGKQVINRVGLSSPPPTHTHIPSGAKLAPACQVVVLGAGLDARTLRLANELTSSRASVWEVDHPASQAAKRLALAQLLGEAQPPEALRFLPVDFAQPGAAAALAARLRDAGLDPSERTLITWEGVVMYLPEAAVNETLAVFPALGGKGSLLVITYFRRSYSDWLRRCVARWWDLRTWLHFMGVFFCLCRLYAGECVVHPGWDNEHEVAAALGPAWRVMWDAPPGIGADGTPQPWAQPLSSYLSQLPASFGPPGGSRTLLAALI